MRALLILIIPFLPLAAIGQGANSWQLGNLPVNHSQLIEKKAFDFNGVFPGQVFEAISLSDLNGNLIGYIANIVSPVCDDTLCQIIECALFWDISGRYSGFSISSGKSLTKIDHIKFTSEDYQKLHFLLQDQHSVLSMKRKEELIDPTRKIKSEKLDALTGATALELKDAVVQGASYSSYTLWYLVNGEINQRINTYTKKNLSKEQRDNLLLSKKPQEQLLALQLLTKNEHQDYIKEILDILKESIPLNKQYILKALSESFWENMNNQELICQTFPDLDKSSKSILLGKIKEVKKVSDKTMNALLNELPNLSLNQLEDFFKILKIKYRKLPKNLTAELRLMSESKNYPYKSSLRKLILDY